MIMKTIKHILSEMNNLQGELYQQLIRVINETVGDGVLRVFEDGGLHMNAYEFDYESGQYIEKNIFALAVFDGQLAILLEDYKYWGMHDDELLEQDSWQTLYCGEFYTTPTIECIAQYIGEYVNQ
jgi:hypothetical protein